MKNYKTILTALFVVIIFTACEKEEVNGAQDSVYNQTSIKKKNVKINKSNTITKDDYMILTFIETKPLWISKLNQIKVEPINQNQVAEINNLINELNLSNSRIDLVKSSSFQASAYELLRLTSDEDYLLMFNSLDDYQIINAIPYRNDIETSSNVYPQLHTHILTGDVDPPNNPDPDKDKPCNCNWTCGDAQSSCTHSNCESTSSGCGFFWAFSCDERDELTPSDCAAVGA